MALDTRKVFIDTEWYVRSGLDFSTKTLKSFAEICAAGQVEHYTTSIVAREVEAKIADHVKETAEGLAKLQRKVRSISGIEGLPLGGYLVKLDEAELREKAIGLFRRFLLRSEAIVLEPYEVDANKIFDDYFNLRPPFGLSKKKSEFPDAFSMACIAGVLRGNDKIYIVSLDPDLISFCESNPRCIALNSLDQFLDIYHEHVSSVSLLIKASATVEEPSIAQLIKQALEAEGAFNGAPWEDSEVQDFVVTKVDLSEPSIVSLFDDTCTLTYEVDVDYSVSVSGPDFTNGMYDREDNIVHTFGNTVRNDFGEASFEVEVDASYLMLPAGLVLKNIDVALGTKGSLEVYVEEADAAYN